MSGCEGRRRRGGEGEERREDGWLPMLSSQEGRKKTELRKKMRSKQRDADGPSQPRNLKPEPVHGTAHSVVVR